MADWVPRANDKKILFVIYNTLQFAKHKGMYCGKKKFTDYYGHAWPMCATSPQCENTFGVPLIHHRAELAQEMLKMGLFTVFCHPVSYLEVLPACFVTPACFVAA